MRIWKVGIIGGGPGGLMTAYLLQKFANSNFQVTLFEATNRLGGKILTPQFQMAPVNYEAGAAEFYDYEKFEEDTLKDLIRELGLPISPMGGQAVIMKNQVLGNLEDIGDHLGPAVLSALVEFDSAAKSHTTPLEFYHSDAPEGIYSSSELPDERRLEAVLATMNPELRGYVECLIHSDLATEPINTNLKYGLHNYLMNDPAYMQLYGIIGGNERLPQELASRIHADIRLEHAVTSVERVGSDEERCPIRITSQHAGETHQDEFDYVIVALPHNQIPSVQFQGDRLAAAVKKHYDFYHHPAHYLRITLLFQSAFWKNQFSDSYWMLDQFGGCCMYDESSRIPECEYGILGWLLGGEIAETMSSLTDAELFQAALDSLPQCMRQGREQFLEGRVHRWTAAVNAIPGGLTPQNLDQRHQPEPVDHANLFFVGDYLFDSTLNGVLDSAEYVAGWLAGEMSL